MWSFAVVVVECPAQFVPVSNIREAGMRGALDGEGEEALRRDPEDESAIYQEMMAHRRLGKKDQTESLADCLKQIHHEQQGIKMNYQLREITASDQGNP